MYTIVLRINRKKCALFCKVPGGENQGFGSIKFYLSDTENSITFQRQSVILSTGSDIRYGIREEIL